MIKPSTRLALAIVALLLPACGTTNPSPLAPSPSPEISVPPTDAPASLPSTLPSPTLAATMPPEPTPTATPAPEPVRARYKLDTTLSYWQHHLSVEEQIVYTNNTGEALQELRLMVEPMRYPGVFHLDRMTWGDGTEVAGADWDTNQAQIPLPQALDPGEQVILSIAYQLDLPAPAPSPDTRPVPFGYTARQTNLVDWYPFIAPYVPGKGWLAHQAGYFGEYLVYEMADFEVNIRLSDPSPSLVIAASTAAQQVGEWQRYRLDQARNFAWSVSPEYKVASQTVGDITVTGYWFPFHNQAGEMALQATAQALGLFNDLYGPYQHKSLTVVEADFLDSMEYDGLFFLSYGFYNIYQGALGDYLVAIAAHETAHQWWYGQVANDQALEPWLDEALCTYSERVFYEKLYPQALDWWWEYRLRYGEPKGRVNGSIYDFSGEASPYLAYRGAVYLNGAMFLEDLRKEMGDRAFFAFLQDYDRQYAGKIATSNDFFNLLAQHTNADLSALQAKYFPLAGK